MLQFDVQRPKHNINLSQKAFLKIFQNDLHTSQKLLDGPGRNFFLDTL